MAGNGFMAKLPNGRFRVRWRDPDGANRSRTFDHRGDAKTWLAQVRSQTAVASLPLPRAVPTVTLGQAAEAWWSRKRPTIRARTAVVYDTALRVHLPSTLLRRDIRQVKTDDIDKVLAGLPTETGKKVRTVLRQIFEDAIRHDLCDRNPVLHAQLSDGGGHDGEGPIRPEALPSVEQVEKLALAVPERFKALVLVATFAGLRFGEAAGLHPSHIDLEGCTIRVARQWNHVEKALTAPKTKAGNRTTIFPERIREDLALHVARFSGKELAFCNGEGGPIGPSNFRIRIWQPAVESLGLDGLKFHDLRHVFASTLIAGGVNVALVARLMGHSSPQVTLTVYSHFFEADYSKARVALNTA